MEFPLNEKYANWSLKISRYKERVQTPFATLLLEVSG
jgi:hypothetical protein